MEVELPMSIYHYEYQTTEQQYSPEEILDLFLIFLERLGLGRIDAKYSDWADYSRYVDRVSSRSSGSTLSPSEGPHE